MATNLAAGVKLANARGYVRKHAPYFSPTLYGLVPCPIDGLIGKVGAPMGVTDHLVLIYDPAWVEVEESSVISFALAHEIMHVQLQHTTRASSYPDKKRWNKAGDLFINYVLDQQEASFPTKKLWNIPNWVLMPKKYGFPGGLTADQYYELLEKDSSDTKEPGHNQCCIGNCGGISGNPFEIGIEKNIDVQLGRSIAEVKAICHETASRIKVAIQSAQGRGYFPGCLSEVIQGLDEQESVSWQHLLQNAQRQAIGRARYGGMDYSLTRPSRRSYLRGWPIPGLIERDPVVAVVIDSSGSMGTDKLRIAVTETAGVLRQTGVDWIWLLIADATVQNEPTKVSIFDLVEIEIPGRGGTNFTPGIEALDELDPRPNMAIYLTDGDGTAPNNPPDDMEFVWGLIDTYKKDPPAPWGEVIHI